MIQALPLQVLLESDADVFASSRVERYDLPQVQEEVAGIPRLLLVERRNSSAWGRWSEPEICTNLSSMQCSLAGA